MAGIGLNGIVYAKATLGEDGAVSGYSGALRLGGAISAEFTPASSSGSPLYYDNGIGENDTTVSSGGELKLTVDRLTPAVRSDIFGLKKTNVSVTVGEDTVQGVKIGFSGDEETPNLGLGYVEMLQESNKKKYYALVYRKVNFVIPADKATTLGESVAWVTPELTCNVAGRAVGSSEDWRELVEFPTQAAAEAYLEDYFKATTPPSEPG